MNCICGGISVIDLGLLIEVLKVFDLDYTDLKNYFIHFKISICDVLRAVLFFVT